MKTQFYPLLKTTEAARALGIGKRTLAELIAERKIGFIKIGRSVRFSREDLDAFCDAHRMNGKSVKKQTIKKRTSKTLAQLIHENL